MHAACSHHIAYIAWPAGAWQPDLMSVVHGLQDCSRRLRMLLIRNKTATVHGQQERGSQAYGVRVHGLQEVVSGELAAAWKTTRCGYDVYTRSRVARPAMLLQWVQAEVC